MSKRYPLLDIDPEQSIIITASQRLARQIRASYNQQQSKLAKKVWPTLQVMPWNAWTQQCWELLNERQHAKQDSLPVEQRLAPLPLLLTDKQESYLWQQIVEQSSYNNYLLQTKNTAKKAQQAWLQLQQWQLEVTNEDAWDLDSKAFVEWQLAYQKKLADNHWIDQAACINFINQSLAELKDALPTNVYYVGFEQITPQQEQFFVRLARHNKVQKLQEKAEPRTCESSVKVLAFNSARQEFRAAIVQAIESLQKNYSQNSDYKIAVVVPELEKYKPLLQKILWQELLPNQFKNQQLNLGIYDISLGEAFVKQPLIDSAVELLKLLAGKVEKSALQRLLLTPYWGQSHEQWLVRALLEKRLRTSLRKQWNLTQLLELLRTEQELQGLADLISKLKARVVGQASIESWLAQLSDILLATSWPGYRTLASREQQLLTSLFDGFKQLRQYKILYKKEIGFSQLVGILTALIEEQQFHQELPKAPIQLMGLLETVGLEFDEVWLTGANNQVLPAQPNPNPFISKKVLQENKMPGSSTSREWLYAQQLINNLRASSERLTISYAKQDGDTELLASPLLASYQITDSATSTRISPDFARRLNQSVQMESYQDSYGIEIKQGQLIQGGTGFFKSQINCPFQAYAKYRLQAYPFDQIDEGLSAIERGNLLHNILELFWKEYSASEILLGKSIEQLAQLVEPFVDQVLAEQKQELFFLSIASFVEIERLRLIKLLSQTLEYEQKRPAFYNVISEHKQLAEVAGLKFSMKIDRIDQVEGGHLIVDYKTGSSAKSSLTSEPPREPQLPLYAMAYCGEGKEKDLAGITFLNINAKGVKFEGLADEVSHLNGKRREKRTMQQWLENWNEQLQQIAEQIKQGYAEVIPDSCDFCEYQSICRINQRSIQENLEEGFQEIIEPKVELNDEVNL